MKNPLEKFVLALEDSASALSKPGGSRGIKSKLMISTELRLPIDFLTPGTPVILETGAVSNSLGCGASVPGFPARTSVKWEALASINRGQVLQAAALDSSSKSWKSSARYNLNGWSLKTSRGCSVQTITETFKSSSQNLPNAITWDTRECLMLNISESPKSAAAFSWSAVLDASPVWTSWLMPRQWNQYLVRATRRGLRNQQMLGQALLFRPRQNIATKTVESILALSYLLLKKTDGIRWLSGPERLKYMGFPADWMRPTLKKLMRREMQCPPQLQNGSLKF